MTKEEREEILLLAASRRLSINPVTSATPTLARLVIEQQVRLDNLEVMVMEARAQANRALKLLEKKMETKK